MVSVVIPCYNAARFIYQSIDSILKQTFSAIELIIVDDGSTDDTVRLIREFKDQRIKLILLEENLGNYYARNTGIRAAQGKYIAMFDADDVSECNRIEIQYNYLEARRHVGAIGSNYHLINEAGEIIGKVHRDCKYPEFKIRLLGNNYMLQSTIMIRRHLISRHQLFYQLKYTVASDYDFVTRCSQYFPIYNIPEFLVRYRFHDRQLSSTRMAKQIEFSKAIRRGLFMELDESLVENNYHLIESLMTKRPMPADEMKLSLAVLKELLITNERKKIYHRGQLESFFIEEIAANIYMQKIVDSNG